MPASRTLMRPQSPRHTGIRRTPIQSGEPTSDELLLGCPSQLLIDEIVNATRECYSHSMDALEKTIVEAAPSRELREDIASAVDAYFLLILDKLSPKLNEFEQEAKRLLHVPSMVSAQAVKDGLQKHLPALTAASSSRDRRSSTGMSSSEAHLLSSPSGPSSDLLDQSMDAGTANDTAGTSTSTLASLFDMSADDELSEKHARVDAELLHVQEELDKTLCRTKQLRAESATLQRDIDSLAQVMESGSGQMVFGPKRVKSAELAQVMLARLSAFADKMKEVKYYASNMAATGPAISSLTSSSSSSSSSTITSTSSMLPPPAGPGASSYFAVDQSVVNIPTHEAVAMTQMLGPIAPSSAYAGMQGQYAYHSSSSSSLSSSSASSSSSDPFTSSSSLSSSSSSSSHPFSQPGQPQQHHLSGPTYGSYYPPSTSSAYTPAQASSSTTSSSTSSSAPYGSQGAWSGYVPSSAPAPPHDRPR